MACLVQFGHENSVCYGQRALRRALARMRRLRERLLLVDGAMHAAAVMVAQTEQHTLPYPSNTPYSINPPHQPTIKKLHHPTPSTHPITPPPLRPPSTRV